jgi:UDP-N-acetylmuramoyl-tripeptide--D-alanyl-D-alanine ligase
MKTLARRFIAHWLELQVQQLVAAKKLEVVAVTGSFGKTSTKLAIASVLGQKYRVLAHEGNYNTELGLPLSVFELDVPTQIMNPLAWQKIMRNVKQAAANYSYQVLVLELGIDKPGDMDAFLRYLTPDIGVITAISPVHIEYFKDVEQIADEKFKLALGSRQTIICSDSQYLVARASKLQTRPITFGASGVFRLADQVATEEGIKGSLCLANETIRVQTHVIAEHGLRAVEAAAAVGKNLGLSNSQIKAGVEAFRPVHGRMNPLQGLNGSLIIDDSYNSSPEAAIAAIQTLISLPGKHIAILGSMNELGEYAEEGHRSVGAAAAGSKLDLLVTIGQQARDYLADEALKTMEPEQVKSFDSPIEAGTFVAPLLTAKHVVLAKGSQNGVFAEEGVKLLLANPKDVDKLIRQSAKWQKTKSEQFKVK